MKSPPIRPVWGVDGEGRDINGRHRYVYLCAWQRAGGRVFDLRDHTAGLTTSACLRFLTELPHGRRDIVAGFFFGYDATMILGDLSDKQKSTLHSAGFVTWRAADNHLLYYIEYHPGKSLFVGRLEKALRRGERPNVTTWRWRGGDHWIHVEDVGSYSQRSFVQTIEPWQVVTPDQLAYIADMKGKRAGFDKESPEEVERYCQMECAILARYVAALQGAVLAEGIVPSGWHGPGAIGSALLRREKVDHALSDPTDEGARAAVMAAYFGGRSENFRVGCVPVVCGLDLRSAYPSVLAGVIPATPGLPDLVSGHWRHIHHYDMGAHWAVYRVSWSIPGIPEYIMPFPVRQAQRIWYPTKGRGWYHASLVRAAMELYEPYLKVEEGWVYEPDRWDAQPFDFIRSLADRRVLYKTRGDPRERVLKLALNSLYGKLAQHAVHENRHPPFQSYYAAGYVTAATQAELLREVYRDGHDGQDVVGFATDGLFTEHPRTARVGQGLGEWEVGPVMGEVYIVQPGVYYARDGKRRTRGFGHASLTYEQVSQVWQRDTLYGSVSYTERRFVGLGYCAGIGDYADYGQWRESGRVIRFYPDKPIIGPAGTAAFHLGPVMLDTESEPYIPASPLDSARGYLQMDALLEELWRRDQPG